MRRCPPVKLLYCEIGTTFIISINPGHARDICLAQKHKGHVVLLQEGNAPIINARFCQYDPIDPAGSQELAHGAIPLTPAHLGQEHTVTVFEQDRADTVKIF